MYENDGNTSKEDWTRYGNLDIAFSNGWYEAPDDTAGTWVWHEVTQIYGISNVQLRDMDSDGDLDMIVSAGHHGDGMYLLVCPSDPITEPWAENAIDPDVVHPEGLAVLDLDHDGDYDVVSCDLDFDHWDQEVHHVYLYENTGLPFSPSWNKQDISGNSYASHKLQIADINEDGRMDIISEGAGYKIISYYENATPDTTGISETPMRGKKVISARLCVTSPVSASMSVRFWFSNGYNVIVNAEVWDIAGRLLGKQTVQPSAQGVYKLTELPELRSGNYVLIVKSRDGNTWRNRFQVIQ